MTFRFKMKQFFFSGWRLHLKKYMVSWRLAAADHQSSILFFLKIRYINDLVCFSVNQSANDGKSEEEKKLCNEKQDFGTWGDDEQSNQHHPKTHHYH